MNKNIPRNHGSRLKRVIPDQGNKFAYDAIDQVTGEWDRLLRKLREKYGYTKGEANDEQIEYLMEENEEDTQDYADEFKKDDTSNDDPE